jgi:hypothetical protein
MVRRIARLLLHPRDAWLALHIGIAIAVLPRWIAAHDLRDMHRLRRSRLPLPRAAYARIAWFRAWWLQQALFRARDTCYVRALVLYRFLDAPDADVRLHLGIEARTSAEDRLRGHAWVSVRGAVVEAPPAVQEGRIREIALWPARS